MIRGYLQWEMTMLTAAELFQHFRENKPQIDINGAPYWIVEGDLLVNQVQLWSYALQRTRRGAEGSSEERERLVAMTDKEGRIVRWRQGKLLTYCVRRATFTAKEYEILLKAIYAATADWQAICGVQFQHMSEFDLEESSNMAPPLFDVVRIRTQTKAIATAFFPSDPPERRHIYMYPLFFAANLGYDRTGILRHELGHVLGFRHEHIRHEAPPDCPEEGLLDHTFNLSDYDPKSVMHYFCGGVGTREMRLTEVDRQGARQVYGPPNHEVVYFD
jgi:hypothetical protein